MAQPPALCEVMLENLPADNAVLSSDESHFRVWGCVNKNFRYYAIENPRQLHEQPLHSEYLLFGVRFKNLE